MKRRPLSFGQMLAVYSIAIVLPFTVALSEGIDTRWWFPEIVSLLNVTGMAALMAQFFLASRLAGIADRAGIDNSIHLHRKVGEYLALFFLLHPLLILLPRVWIAPEQFWQDLWSTFTAPRAKTGVYAWGLLIGWVLMAKYKERLKISYDTWRVIHGVGLSAVAILAMLHVITVGRHGRYDPWFRIFWIVVCAAALGTTLAIYLIRPLLQRRHPFRIVSVSKVSASDWCLTLEKDADFPFAFDGGQFLWINTSGKPFARVEHPFSIASSPLYLPRLSFIIRNLGDYTAKLDKLVPGQRVFVDGPHGAFTLSDRKAKGIALIAGGCGIGPILGLLRQLRDTRDPRPVRLIYGNRVYEQCVFQDEIHNMSNTLDFRQQLVLFDPAEGTDAYCGVIDRAVLESSFNFPDRNQWDFYVCGPPMMVEAVVENLEKIKVPKERILFEQLAF